MEEEQALGGLRADLVTLVRQHPRQPEGLARPLPLVDVDIAPPAVHEDEPDQPSSHDEPDDEQPPVELGVHRREV